MILGLSSLSEPIVDGRKEFTTECLDNARLLGRSGCCCNPSRLLGIRKQGRVEHRG